MWLVLFALPRLLFLLQARGVYAIALTQARSQVRRCLQVHTGQGTGNQLAHPSHFIALPEMLLPEVPCLFQVIESTTPLEEVGKQQGISPFVFPVRIEDGVKLDLRIGVW